MANSNPLKPIEITGIPSDERRLLERVAMIDPAERTKLAMAVLGPRPTPDTILAPLLATILLLHAVEQELRQTERERFMALIRSIAEAHAIADHKRENGGDSL